MLQAFANLPPIARLAFVGGGTMITGFSSKLPDALQLAGLLVGLSLATFGIIATIWHYLSERRIKSGRGRLTLEPATLLPAFAIIALVGVLGVGGCLVWQYLRPSQVQVHSAPSSSPSEAPKTSLASAGSLDPFAPPPAKNPFRDGPIFERKFTSDEAEIVLKALRDITEIADFPTSASNVFKAIPSELFRRNQIGASRSDNPRNWAHTIRLIGFDAAIVKLQELQNRAAEFRAKIGAVFATYPRSYSLDLHRLVGDTGISELENSAAAYKDGLNLLKKIAAQPNELDNLVHRSLENDASRLEQAAVNFAAWQSSFMNNRAPAARRELEARLK